MYIRVRKGPNGGEDTPGMLRACVMKKFGSFKLSKRDKMRREGNVMERSKKIDELIHVNQLTCLLRVENPELGHFAFIALFYFHDNLLEYIFPYFIQEEADSQSGKINGC